MEDIQYSGGVYAYKSLISIYSNQDFLTTIEKLTKDNIWAELEPATQNSARWCIYLMGSVAQGATVTMLVVSLGLSAPFATSLTVLIYTRSCKMARLLTNIAVATSLSTSISSKPSWISGTSSTPPVTIAISHIIDWKQGNTVKIRAADGCFTSARLIFSTNQWKRVQSWS